MSVVRLQCLETLIKSGTIDFPVFIGFLPARQILAIAAAPSFSEAMAHVDIARNVLNPPIEDWQRPLDNVRVDHIRRFYDNTGEIMPNPVLLSENALSEHDPFEIRRQRGAGGAETDVIEIDVPIRSAEEKPLWVLDGQHRITGLASSAQNSNPVPFVLLMNRGPDVYSPEIFAKLFAQVTTSAQPLNALHEEWLTFGFRLGDYSPAEAASRAHTDAMRATAHLCESQRLAGNRNPFFNSVRFNPFPEGAVRPRGGGFEYNCIEFKELLRTDYYQVAEGAGRLPPEHLAAEIASSYLALQRSVTGSHPDTVFFGDSASGRGHKPMQDGFVRGVLARLARKPVTNWDQLLSDLNFQGTDWDFRSWVETVGGAQGTLARKIAEAVFRRVMVEGHLPGSTGTLSDYLQGNEAEATLLASNLTPRRRPSRQDRMEISVTPSVRTHDIGARRHLKLTVTSENVGRVKVIEARSPLGSKYEEGLRTGVVIDGQRETPPLKLMLRMEHYGGRSQDATVNVRWST